MLHSRLATIEPLERRELFTGVSFRHHHLTITGSTARPNTITVGLTPNGQSVTADIRVLTPRRTTVTFSRTIPLSLGLNVVTIRGGKLDDIITVDQTYGSFPAPALIVGGAGFDTLSGGDEPDIIYGGKGDDSLNGGGGDDTLLGQAGNDILNGGDGNDFLAGGASRDQMYGDNGNDTIADARGPDVAIGGPGSNTFFIHSLQQDYDNDYDKTKDKIRLFTYNYATSSSSSTFLGGLFPIYNVL